MKNLAAEWNKKCGNFINEDPVKYKETLLNQVERVIEEAEEVKEAIISDEPVHHLLKELADLKVTADGLFYLSDLPVEEAYKMVMEDNDKKWTKDFEEIVDILNSKYSQETHEIVSSEVDGETYYSIHRLSDYKICKLYTHEDIDFSSIL